MSEHPEALAAQHDVLLLDLDGTVYLSGQIIDHVAESLLAARGLGARSMFVTNNASRSPRTVAAALTEMGVAAAPEDVLTSPEAAAGLLADRHPAGSKVLVVGAPFLAETMTAAGLVPVRTIAEDPVAVVQGHSPDTCWQNLAEACLALRAGADWVACNTDTTLPTDRGLLPGNGAMVQALVAATGLRPRVAGKPNSPLLEQAVDRAGGRRPLVVGDRLDTDIEAAVTAGMPSLLVLTGVSGAADLVAAPVERRPTHLAFDLRGLVDATRGVCIETAAAPGWALSVDGDSGVIAGPDDESDLLPALAMIARTAWRTPVSRWRAEGATAQSVLGRWGLTASSVSTAAAGHG